MKKTVLLLIFVFKVALTYGQSCEKRLKMVVDGFNSFNDCSQVPEMKRLANIAVAVINECPIYVAQNQTEFNKAKKRFEEVYIKLGCTNDGLSSAGPKKKTIRVSESEYFIKHNDKYVKRDPRCSNEFTHSLCSCDACACDWCKKVFGKIDCVAFKERFSAYLNAKPQYNGDEEVDEYGNFINGSSQSSAGNAQTSSIQQQREIPKINLTEIKTKQPDSVIKRENVSNIITNTEVRVEFDEADFNKEAGNKKNNDGEVTIVQNAYHIESRGRSPFNLISKLAGYNPKFDGVLDIDVTINDVGKLIGVSVASLPKDEDLNAAITNYIWNKYAKEREWQPALASNNRYVTSNVNYKTPFSRSIALLKTAELPVDQSKIDKSGQETNPDTDQSIYQKFNAFKTSLINAVSNYKPLTNNEKEADKSAAIVDQMDAETKRDLLVLTAKPNVSMIDIRSYITKRIKSVSKGLKQIFEEKSNELDGLMSEVK